MEEVQFDKKLLEAWFWHQQLDDGNNESFDICHVDCLV